ncbi:MAG TPA: hypothetical protein VJH03_00165 [Blastocatellia bacterium]|nr:hypothetical protein [Blastocatellia bacterium]
MSTWNARERRSPQERRAKERRRSTRYTAENLIVLDAMTWVDSEGTDRRRKIRRRKDREQIADKVLHEFSE